MLKIEDGPHEKDAYTSRAALILLVQARKKGGKTDLKNKTTVGKMDPDIGWQTTSLIK